MDRALGMQLRGAAAGLAGADKQLDPPPPVSGNAYADNDAPRLPADLIEALAGFANSELARQAFSPPVYEHLLGLGSQELKATRQQVTDWELRRGFENA
jgi:glutamine synthetase